MSYDGDGVDLSFGIFIINGMNGSSMSYYPFSIHESLGELDAMSARKNQTFYRGLSLMGYLQIYP